MFFPNLNRWQAAEIDADLQTRPGEGPNTSSVWIWRKSVQRFRRYFIHKQKSRRQRQAHQMLVRNSILVDIHVKSTMKDTSPVSHELAVCDIHRYCRPTIPKICYSKRLRLELEFELELVGLGL